MTDPPALSDRWPTYLGHVLTVIALALGGLSSFHALRAEVVELRSDLHALALTEADHTRRGGDDSHALRDEIRELRGELRDLKQFLIQRDKQP